MLTILNFVKKEIVWLFYGISLIKRLFIESIIRSIYSSREEIAISGPRDAVQS